VNSTGAGSIGSAVSEPFGERNRLIEESDENAGDGTNHQRGDRLVQRMSLCPNFGRKEGETELGTGRPRQERLGQTMVPQCPDNRRSLHVVVKLDHDPPGVSGYDRCHESGPPISPKWPSLTLALHKPSFHWL